jgi:Flp pilus assembly protein TadG
MSRSRTDSGASGARALNVSFLRRFRDDRRGNVAMIFAFAIIPLLLLIGMAVDFGQATRVRGELQNATDVAALAVARDGLSVTDDKLQGIAKKYLDANYTANYPYTLNTLTFDRPTVTAEVTTSAKVSTTFLQLMGVTQIPVKAYSQTKGLGVEVAMVLDNSGSMDESAGGSKKITALKAAANEFLDVMFGTATSSERFKISVVPFSTAVNVGPANKTAAWMDTGTTPSASVHSENFANNVNRFSFFVGGANAMKNVAWAGCVISRAGNYATDDTVPTSGDTLFTPWFAPDEPDGDNYKDYGTGQYDYRTGSFNNNYINDEGTYCTGSNALVKAYDKDKQARTCKYKGATPDLSYGKGPNYNCTTTAITPLTNSRTTLNAAMTAMQPAGNTNILEGFTWGWRTLSPTTPFTEGKAYNAPNNRKVIVLMTDGENFLSAGGNSLNLTVYSSFGYSSNYGAERLGTPTSSESTNTSRIDEKTATACANAKAKGIIIYTIAFDLDSTKARTLLSGCATEPKAPYFNAPNTSAELTPVFLQIAESINALRIAE